MIDYIWFLGDGYLERKGSFYIWYICCFLRLWIVEMSVAITIAALTAAAVVDSAAPFIRISNHFITLKYRKM